MTGELKLHWYCFSYNGVDPESGKICNASTYTGYANKGVSLQMINTNKNNAKVSEDAVLISVSYLGKMTKAEFTGE